MDKQVSSSTSEEHPPFHPNRIETSVGKGLGQVNSSMEKFSSNLPAFVLALGEALILSWWLLWLIDLFRPGAVSTIWNLNWLLLAALILLLLGLILGAKTGRVNSLVALLSGILAVVIVWQRIEDPVIVLLAPVAGLIIFVLFKYKFYD